MLGILANSPSASPLLRAPVTTVLFFAFLEAFAEDSSWIKWRNGDELHGEVINAPEQLVGWRAPLFSGPITLEPGQVEGIHFRQEPGTTSSPSPQFRILLNNKDRIEGDLLSLSSESATIESDAFAVPVEIPRGDISRIVQIDSDRLRYTGPGELTGWTSTGRDRKATEWFSDLGGAFATHQWSGNLFKEIELPSQTEISFTAAFPRGRPEFEIGLLRDAGLGPMIETWDNHLVLTFRTQFVPIMELSEDTRLISFRIFWNQETGDLRVCHPSGEVVASLDDVFVERVSDQPSQSKVSAEDLARGFSILNRTPELRLEHLSIQEWDGKTVPIIDLTQSRLVVANRPPRMGTKDVTLAQGSMTLSVGSRKIPLSDFEELVLTPGSLPPSLSREDQTRVVWQSGTNLSGTYEKFHDGFLYLTPAWSPSAVSLNLDNAREIRFPDLSTPVEPSADLLTSEEIELRGTTRVIGNAKGESIIGWLAPGAKSPVPFAETAEISILRPAHPASQSDLAATIGQARVFFENDEILTGELISISESSIEFSSSVTGRTTLPTAQIRAVDIGSAGRILDGFSDSEWETVADEKGEITSTKQQVTLKGADGGVFGNSSLLLGDVIEFDATWKQVYGAFTLRLFADSPNPDGPSINIVAVAQGNRLFVSKLKTNGAFSPTGDQVSITENKAQFKILVAAKSIEIQVNGKSALHIPISEGQLSGNGIYFKLGGGWQGWNQAENEVTIDNFSVSRSPGSVPFRIIESKVRERILSIPRVHQDDTPTHLLIAPNSDLLRGKLIEANANGMTFLSKSRTLQIPHQRVSAVVWLKPPVSDLPESSKGGSDQAFEFTHQFTLMNGSHLRLAAEEIEGSHFVGRSELLGECRIAIENIREMFQGPSRPSSEADRPEITAYRDWNLSFTPEPNIPGASQTPQSPLIGQKAPSFSLTMLKGKENFELAKQEGKVVVLDFWASWCGPCIKAMPEVIKAVRSFPPDKVSFCAVNQGETRAIVSSFLEARGWEDTPTAFDFDMQVSHDYQVDGIPHTVVIDPAGNLIWSHSGYTKDLGKLLSEAIDQGLNP